MSFLKYAILSALCLGALALHPATAEASITNRTQAWCKVRGPVDQTLVTGESATLIFKANGNLVLEPLNHLVNKIWSSGTGGGQGFRVCWDAAGGLTIYNALGVALWTRSGGAPPADPGGSFSYDYVIEPRLAGCELSARASTYVAGPVWMPPATWTTAWRPTGPKFGSSRTQWAQAGICPVTSANAVFDDFCMDDAGAQTLAQSEWAELVWRPTAGYLQVRGIGTAAGVDVWHSQSSGQKKQLCFHNNGSIAIYDSSDHAVWTTPAGATTTSYMLEIDACRIQVVPLDGSAPLFATSPPRCPQAEKARGYEAIAGAADIVLVENEVARLAFQPDGNLVLRSLAGEEIWHSALPPGRGHRVAFQTDGNLVIYNSANSPVWGAKMWDNTVTSLVLDGCVFSLLAGSTVKFSRGVVGCEVTSLSNAPAWSLIASGSLTLLRTPQARLVWQGDGNLVLYTASGVAIWSSATGGNRGKTLAFQADGNLVIYDANNAPLWSSDTWYTTPTTLALKLGDRCALKLARGSATEWTGTTSCAVVNETFEQVDGNSTFGTVMRTHVTAEDAGTARLDSDTALEAVIFGLRYELFSATAYQTELDDGSSLETGSVTVLGESAIAVNISYSRTFFEAKRTFMVGPVPVAVTAGATGDVGLALAFAGGALTLTPSAGLYATASAGVGVESSLGGASAGVRGSLTLLELSLPISFRITLPAGQAPRYQIDGSLTLGALSGSLALYAKAYIEVFGVEIGVEASKTLFSWTGVEWSKSLFAKSGSF